MNASVCAPLHNDEEVYGMLCVRDDRIRDAFSPEEVQLIRGLAAQASIAIENSRLYQRLRQRDRLATLGEMAAGLAHEIRNPLGAIKASAQFLAEPDSGEEQVDPEFLDIIVEEVDRLNRVVSSFLDYARPSSGDPTPTDVNLLVKRTLTLLEKDFDGRIDVVTSLGADLPRVRIDAEQLRQVVINLCGNAAQAMETQGRLTVRTAERFRTVDGHARRWVELAVTDTGPGIPKRVLQNLFVPFVTTKDRGTGLGLAISQRLVNGAGGHIEVRSHPGVGTTFFVRLPAAEEQREATGRIARQRSSRPPPPIPSDPGPMSKAGGLDGVGEETASSVASSR